MAPTDTRTANANVVTNAVASTQLGLPTSIPMERDSSTSHVAASDALLRSPFGRLPPEIRNKIYTLMLTCSHGLEYDIEERSWKPMHDGTSISQALSITATCKQIRAETKLMFFALNDITIQLLVMYTDHTSKYAQIGPKKAVHISNLIPSTLIPPCNRLILEVPFGERVTWKSIMKFVRSFRHLQIFLQVGVNAYRWGSPSYRVTEGNFESRPICLRGTAVSMHDCSSFELVFPLGDPEMAQAAVEDLYRTKVASIEIHRNNRLCPVRYELEKLLQSFEPARAKLMKLVLGAFQYM